MPIYVNQTTNEYSAFGKSDPLWWLVTSTVFQGAYGSTSLRICLSWVLNVIRSGSASSTFHAFCWSWCHNLPIWIKVSFLQLVLIRAARLGTVAVDKVDTMVTSTMWVRIMEPTQRLEFHDWITYTRFCRHDQSILIVGCPQVLKQDLDSPSSSQIWSPCSKVHDGICHDILHACSILHAHFDSINPSVQPLCRARSHQSSRAGKWWHTRSKWRRWNRDLMWLGVHCDLGPSWVHHGPPATREIRDTRMAL